MRTSTATALEELPTGTTTPNIVAAPHIRTGRPRIGMEVTRAANPWPTARKGLPTVKLTPAKEAALVKLEPAKGLPTRMRAQAKGLPIATPVRPSGLPAAEPPGVNGRLPLASPPAAELPGAEPTARDRAPVVEAKAPSEGVPVDSADPALAPLVAAVPPASDLEEAEAVVVAGGADKNIHHGDTATRRKQASPVGLWSAAALGCGAYPAKVLVKKKRI